MKQNMTKLIYNDNVNRPKWALNNSCITNVTHPEAWYFWSSIAGTPIKLKELHHSHHRLTKKDKKAF